MKKASLTMYMATAIVAAGALRPTLGAASEGRHDDTRSIDGQTIDGQVLDLAGRWRFALDRDDLGVGEEWFRRELSGALLLPGSLQAQGEGDDVTLETAWTGQIVDRSFFTDPKYAKYREPGNIKVPFWLQPEKHFVGAAWYQREVDVPESWRGKRILLHLERPHWETRLWVGEREVGSRESLSVPHVFDLTRALSPGKNRLTLRVDNRVRIRVGLNSHSVSDHTQSNWNGVVGRIALVATNLFWIEDVQVYPDAKRRSVRVLVRVGNGTGTPQCGRLSLQASAASGSEALKFPRLSSAVAAEGATAAVEMAYPLGEEARLWDEFSPALYRLWVELDGEGGATSGGAPSAQGKLPEDATTVTFGLREISTEGTRFVLNGRPLFLRGTLECSIFPLTGYPPTDVASWRRIVRIAKAHGLNHIRFHSWCPPRAAFVAADELGFYYHVECASWANGDSSVGDGEPIDRWIRDEGDRILREYGNHPSFLLLAYGNEPAGANQNAYLGSLVTSWKRKDPRRLYTSGAGWPEIPENDYHLTPTPRIQGWGEGLKSRINAKPPETLTDYRDFCGKREVPVISHEIGQWCVYPNLDEIRKYTGVLKARNFEVFRDFLREKGMERQARDFLMASGKLQALCYKEEIESALRTPGMGGFQLLDLHDFPGQGTALVGVLDPFWDSKGYISADEYRRFAGSTVPLARLQKRIWTERETLRAEAEVAHFGARPLEGIVPRWRLLDASGATVKEGTLPKRDVPLGNCVPLGSLEVDLADVRAPARYSLLIALEGAGFENDWDLWVYPEKVETEEGGDVLIAERFDASVRKRLAEGARVLLVPEPRRVKGDVALGFSSVFWNTAWTRNQAPHTLGILCDPRHPALQRFPTESHSNWQWWELLSRGAATILDDLEVIDPLGRAMDGERIRPIVQAIDTWFESRRLGLIFEARVLRGKLLVASVDIARDLERRPVARQMLHSLLEYMRGSSFEPVVTVSPEGIAALLWEPRGLEGRGGRVLGADSEAEGHPASNAIDGDPTTIWHTSWDPQPTPHPHSITIDLGRALRLRSVTYLPRQDMSNGRIGRYEIRVSSDPERWGDPVASGVWPDGKDLQAVRLEGDVAGRYLRLSALSEVRGREWASVAEIDVAAE